MAATHTDHAAGCAALIEALGARPARLGLGFRNRLRAGFDIGWHHHEVLELVLHHRGSGSTAVEGGPLVGFAAGDLVVHAPRSRHRQPMRRAGEDWCLHLVLPCRWPAALPPLIHLPAAVLAIDVAAYAALTAQPGAQLAPAAALAQDLRAGAILAEVLVALGRRPADGDAPAAAGGGDLPERCRELIDRRFAGISLIDEVADELGVSPDRLRRRFSARYGHGPRSYLRQVRLRAAQRLLRETPLTLDEVATRCGIGNARQLCDLFRELAGCTPGGWRTGGASAGPAAGAAQR